MNGLGDVLDEFERNADFELLGVDGVSGSGVGDEFERDERGELREDVGRRRNSLVHDRVENRHQAVHRKRLWAEKLSSGSPRAFIFQSEEEEDEDEDGEGRKGRRGRE